MASVTLLLLLLQFFYNVKLFLSLKIIQKQLSLSYYPLVQMFEDLASILHTHPIHLHPLPMTVEPTHSHLGLDHVTCFSQWDIGKYDTCTQRVKKHLHISHSCIFLAITTRTCPCCPAGG